VATQSVTLEAQFKDKASQGLGSLRAGLLGAAAASTTMRKGITSLGASVAGLSTGLASLSTASAGALAKSTKMAAEFRREVALAKTQVDDARISVDFLANTMQDVGFKIPGDFERMPRLMFDIFSTMHPRMEETKRLTEQFTKAATAGFSDIQTVSRTSMQVLNAFFSDFKEGTDTMGIKVEDVTSVLDKQFRMVQRGTGTYEELTSALNRVIPAAKGAGQSVDTMMGSVAFLSRMGVDASMAGTSVARAMETIGRSSETLETMGIRAHDANGELLQLDKIIENMHKEFEGMTRPEFMKALDEAFSGQGWRIQARRFFQLAIPNFELLNSIINDVAMSSGDMQKAFETVEDQPAMQMKLLKQQFKILTQEIGTEFLPHAARLIEKVQGWVKALREFNNTSGTSIGRILTIVSALSAAIAVVTAVVGGFIALRGALAAINVSLAAMVSNITLAVGILGGLGLAAGALSLLGVQFGELGQKALDVASGFEQIAISGSKVERTMLILGATVFPAIIGKWQSLKVASRNLNQSIVSSFRRSKRASKEAAQSHIASARATSQAYANQAASARTNFNAARSSMSAARQDITKYKQVAVKADEQIKQSKSAINSAWGRHGAYVQKVNRQMGAGTVEAQRKIQSSYNATRRVVRGQEAAITHYRNLTVNANQRMAESQQRLRASASSALAARRNLITANQAYTVSLQNTQAASAAAAGRLATLRAGLAGVAGAAGSALRGIGRFLGAGISALFSPVTVLVGGLTALVYWLQKSGQEARETSRKVDELTRSLKDAGGATNELGYESITKQLDLDRSTVKNLENAGIEIRDVVNSLKQGEDLNLDQKLEGIKSKRDELRQGRPNSIFGAFFEDEELGRLVKQEEAILALQEETEGFESRNKKAMADIRREIETQLDQSITSTDAYNRAVQGVNTTHEEAVNIATKSLIPTLKNSEDAMKNLSPKAREVAAKMNQGSDAAKSMAKSTEEDNVMLENLEDTMGEMINTSKAMEAQFERITEGSDRMSQAISDARDKLEEEADEDENVVLGLGNMINAIKDSRGRFDQFFKDIKTIVRRGAPEVASMIAEMGEEGENVASKLANAGDAGFQEFVINARKATSTGLKEIKDFAKEASFSIDEWITDLRDQAQAFEDFSNNLIRVAQKFGPELAKHLAGMGPEGALPAEKLAKTEDIEIGEKLLEQLGMMNKGLEGMSKAIKEAEGPMSKAFRSFAASAEGDMDKIIGMFREMPDEVIKAMEFDRQALATAFKDAKDMTMAEIGKFRNFLNSLNIEISPDFLVKPRINTPPAGIGPEKVTGDTVPGPGTPQPGGFQHGGFIPGLSTPKDKVPVMATGGEFIIQRNAAQALGPQTLDAINQGRVPFDPRPPVGPSPGAAINDATSSQQSIHVEVHNPTPEPASTSITRELRKRSVR
jgi:TP901 family phage tail tape measure protein